MINENEVRGQIKSLKVAYTDKLLDHINDFEFVTKCFIADAIIKTLEWVINEGKMPKV